jgi:hypothetical protein
VNRRAFINALPAVQYASNRVLHRQKASEQAYWHGVLRLVTTKQRHMVAKQYLKHIKQYCMEQYMFAFNGAQLNYELLHARLPAPNRQYAVDIARQYATKASAECVSYHDYIQRMHGFNWYRYDDETWEGAVS